MALTDDLDRMTVDDLRARGSLKWTLPPEGQLGAFVAEMDLPVAPAILEAVGDAVRRELLTYLPPYLEARAAAATASFQQARHGWDVDPADTHLLSGVVPAFLYTWRHLVPPGTPVVLPTPAYMPFLTLPALHGMSMRTVSMTESAGRYAMDLDALRVALTGGGLLILVNPHNPTGRVFDRSELLALADVVEETGSTVFADEIHAPLVYPGSTHLPYASLSPATAAHTVTAVSASKGWNVPGLACAQLILTGDVYRDRWAAVDPAGAHGATPLGAVAAEAAYLHGVEHLDECLRYLDVGVDLFAEALTRALPEARFRRPEGTYLGWLDLRGIAAPDTVPERCQVWGTDGADCGTPGFLRLTLATSHPLLRELASRLGRLRDD